MDAAESRKAKSARRVIEVLEFFDKQNRRATVMDIARRFDRPQSSTSELLAFMVEMGLLYKDRASRTFRPTPRAAMLGSAFQPSVVRDGRLSMLIDHLSAETGLGVAVVGMVGLKAQIFSWAPGTGSLAAETQALCGGASVGLHESAVGWLLLSTAGSELGYAMLRRLRAETAAERPFDAADIREKVRESGERGFATGPAGFQAGLQTCSSLLPVERGDSPLALSLIYTPSEVTMPNSLIVVLQRAVRTRLQGFEKSVVDVDAYCSRLDDPVWTGRCNNKGALNGNSPQRAGDFNPNIQLY